MRADQDTKRAALGYLVALIASLDRAAARLSVKVAELRALLTGHGDVPEGMFLEAVEMLLRATADERAAARDRIMISNLPDITPELERLLERQR